MNKEKIFFKVGGKTEGRLSITYQRTRAQKLMRKRPVESQLYPSRPAVGRQWACDSWPFSIWGRHIWLCEGLINTPKHTDRPTKM